MDTLKFDGQLEVDTLRGVIYFHSATTGSTVLRICGLQIPSSFSFMDISNPRIQSYVKGD